MVGELPLGQLGQSILVLLQDIVNLIVHFGSFGNALLGMFGIPSVIIIGGYTLNTGGLISTIIVILALYLLLTTYAKYSIYIGVVGVVLLFVSIVGTVWG